MDENECKTFAINEIVKPNGTLVLHKKKKENPITNR